MLSNISLVKWWDESCTCAHKEQPTHAASLQYFMHINLYIRLWCYLIPLNSISFHQWSQNMVVEGKVKRYSNIPHHKKLLCVFVFSLKNNIPPCVKSQNLQMLSQIRFSTNVILYWQPAAHGAMGCGQKSFKLMWWCHQLLPGFLPKTTFPDFHVSHVCGPIRVISGHP